MRVKHKDAPKKKTDPSMALIHWHTHYLPNNKYLNYEFYDVPDIFDLFEIGEKTGNLTYVKSGFGSEISPILREKPQKYLHKPHDTKYLDEHLMPIKSISIKIQSLSPLLKVVKYMIPSIKLDTQRKRHITIVVLMILTIVAMFVIAYYQNVF